MTACAAPETALRIVARLGVWGSRWLRKAEVASGRLRLIEWLLGGGLVMAHVGAEGGVGREAPEIGLLF